MTAALIVVHKHRQTAVRLDPGYTTIPVLEQDQAPFRIDVEAVGADSPALAVTLEHRIHERAQPLGGIPLVDSVATEIAEEQIGALANPDRTFGERKAVG